MNVEVLTRVRKWFSCGDRRTDRHNQREWVRSVRALGDRWLLKKRVERAGSRGL